MPVVIMPRFNHTVHTTAQDAITARNDEKTGIIVTVVIISVAILTWILCLTYRKYGRFFPPYHKPEQEQQQDRHISILNVNSMPMNGQSFWDGYIEPQYLTAEAGDITPYTYPEVQPNRRTSSQFTLNSRLSLNLEPFNMDDLSHLTSRFSTRTASTNQDMIVPSDYILGRASLSTTINISLDEPERAPTPGPGLVRLPVENAGVTMATHNIEEIINQAHKDEEVSKDEHHVREVTKNVLVAEDDNTFVVGDSDDEELEEVQLEEVELRQLSTYAEFTYTGGASGKSQE